MSKSFVVLLILAVVIGAGLGGAFAGGVALGKSSSEETATPLAGEPAGASFQTGGPNRPGQLGQGQGGRPQQGQFGSGAAGSTASNAPTDGTSGFSFPRRGGTSGTIESVEGNVITIKTTEGPVEVTFTDETSITQISQVSADDLKPGVQVMVMGQPGEDGAVTAANIVIAPEGAGSFFGGGRTGGRGFSRGVPAP